MELLFTDPFVMVTGLLLAALFFRPYYMKFGPAAAVVGSYLHTWGLFLGLIYTVVKLS